MGAGFGRLLGQSCSHGEHIKCSPACAELAIDQTPRPSRRASSWQQQPKRKKGLPRPSTGEPLLVSISQPIGLSRSKNRRAKRRSSSNVTQGPGRAYGATSIASSARKGGHLMWPPSCAGLPEQAMLPHTPAQVRRDHDSLTIGAKPFISFLVWPVFSNWTSIMSPATEITVPVPKVL